MLVRQTVNVNQREKALNMQLTCKSGRETYLTNRLKQITSESRISWSSEIFTLNSPSARSVNLQKIAYYSGARRILWITYFKLSILQKSCSESSLLTTNVRGPWIQSSRPRNFKLSVKRTVDNNSYIRKNDRRLLNTIHVIHTCYWCWTWKSLDLRSAAIVRLLPLSSFSVSVSS